MCFSSVCWQHQNHFYERPTSCNPAEVYVTYKIFIGSLAGFVVFWEIHLLWHFIWARYRHVCAILHRFLLTCFPTKSLFPQPLINSSTPRREASATVGLVVAFDTCHQWTKQLASYGRRGRHPAALGRFWTPVKNRINYLSICKYPIVYRVLYIPGGCLGSLNHQEYEYEHEK